MLRSILLLVVAISFTGCAMANRGMGVMGVWYSGYSLGQSSTAQMAVKKGQACASSILGIIATGDASIDAARRNGGIRSIANVDEEYFGVLGIYASVCTNVYGK